MAISIESLHIGSHVLYNGERVEVDSIFSHDDYEYHKHEVLINAVPDSPANLCVSADDLSPIPITKELLKEINAEKYAECFYSYFVWVGEVGDYKIEFKIIGDRNVVGIFDKANAGRLIAECMNIRYLHELEAFVYLTTKEHLL